MEAVFPPNAMAIKRDEQDGSVYVMLAAANPFTLFLTTESGRHFSVTVNGEESLGKTIELVPVLPVVAASKTHAPITNPKKSLRKQSLKLLLPC
ncbi:type-F conjugative transfer system secretin TraK [Legionella pneumophila]|nr:type-F conjugative transfer system secretin TraK [Legionella pneumophila]